MTSKIKNTSILNYITISQNNDESNIICCFLLLSFTLSLLLSERMVNLCVTSEIRNIIKQEKGIHSYDSFFKILFSELINNKINSSSKGLQI
jgi:hypothetical protein